MKSLHALLRNPLVVIVTGVLLSVVVVAALVPAGVVEASARQDVCDAIGGSGPAGDCETTGDPTVSDTLEAAINILSLLIGAIAIIMIIIGGIRYITSAGDANSAKGARDTIIYAVVGLVVAAVAQAIVQFVLQRV